MTTCHVVCCSRRSYIYGLCRAHLAEFDDYLETIPGTYEKALADFKNGARKMANRPIGKEHARPPRQNERRELPPLEHLDRSTDELWEQVKPRFTNRPRPKTKTGGRRSDDEWRRKLAVFLERPGVDSELPCASVSEASKLRSSIITATKHVGGKWDVGLREMSVWVMYIGPE